MTCTHAALKRRDLVELGFKVMIILELLYCLNLVLALPYSPPYMNLFICPKARQLDHLGLPFFTCMLQFFNFTEEKYNFCN